LLLPEAALDRPSQVAVLGLLLISIASMNFTFTLLLHATAIYVNPKIRASK
jgi:hypothetical protein